MRNVTSKIIIVLTVFAVYAFTGGGMGYRQRHGGWGHWLFLLKCYKR
jgi:hypothetical protein